MAKLSNQAKSHRTLESSAAQIRHTVAQISTSINSRRLNVMIAAVLIAPREQRLLSAADDEQWLGSASRPREILVRFRKL